MVHKLIIASVRKKGVDMGKYFQSCFIYFHLCTSSEKVFLKYKGGNRNIKQNLLNEYRNAQNIFDKRLRATELAYNNEKVNQIENCSTSNPKEFWNHLKKLGPRVNRKIPVKVKTENGYTTNETEVLQEWKTDFSKLLNNTNDTYYDNHFLDNVDRSLLYFETQMETETFVQNAMIDTDITIDEVEVAVTKLKNGKTTGVDNIPNEVIKKDSVLLWWYRLFQVCFENGLVPSIWRNAIISPIPKCATKDPFVPLNYRGISLFSCVSKTYSSILNNRIVKYCNLMGFFPEEQNGFWKNRSCQDHIYSLTTIIRNRLTENKGTYCAFIDMEKAFDWVNRKILLYKLLNYNIDGKMYKSIKNTSHKCLIMYWTKWVTAFRVVWKCLWCSTGWLFITNTVQLVYQWFGYTLKRVWTNTRPPWCAHKFFIICRWPCDNGRNRGTAAKFTEPGFQLVFSTWRD